jgi:hypothetical protein
MSKIIQVYKKVFKDKIRWSNDCKSFFGSWKEYAYIKMISCAVQVEVTIMNINVRYMSKDENDKHISTSHV